MDELLKMQRCDHARPLERSLITEVNGVDNRQLSLCVFATLCIAALFALDI